MNPDGVEQDGFAPLSVDKPNPSFERYPINIVMGSRESLNEANAKRHELAVDVFYLPMVTVQLWRLRSEAA